MKHQKRMQTRSPRNDRPANKPVATYRSTRARVGRNVGPTQPLGRSLSSDRVRDGSSLSCDRLVRGSINGYDPKPCILVSSSMLVPEYRSYINSHSHQSELSLKLYNKNRGKFMFIDKNRNKRFELKDGPNRSKTRLETHLQFFKENPIDIMAINVKFPRIIMKIEEN
ncbi:hypothetical protein IGI04_018678 [Brassica rapa subsp. trilocularis]|uniref:Tubby C-terminal domain-containing protein n=1 Tax=Brassica rapa subsp. trilocularis TaxID=1813537 RepID=A0ABQ7MDM8_BRACM|nr:hypothetical protein IGI04_018678 [Brassica rapa subsp. trilocularis]